MRPFPTAAALCLTLLTACGGGGGGGGDGSNGATTDPTAAVLQEVRPAPAPELTVESQAAAIHYRADRTGDLTTVGRHGAALTAALPTSSGTVHTSGIFSFFTAPFDVISGIFGGGGSGGGGSHGPTLTDYFPAGANDTWTYEGDTAIVQGADPTLLFDLTQEERATFGFTLQAQADGLYFVSQEVAGGTITAFPPLLWIPNRVDRPLRFKSLVVPEVSSTLTFQPADGSPAHSVDVRRSIFLGPLAVHTVGDQQYPDVLHFSYTDEVRYEDGSTRRVTWESYIARGVGEIDVQDEYVVPDSSPIGVLFGSGPQVDHRSVLVEATVGGIHYPAELGGHVGPVPAGPLCDPYPAVCIDLGLGDLRLLALTGEAVEGEPLDRLSNPVVNDDGTVYFEATLQPTTSLPSPHPTTVLYRFQDGVITPLARNDRTIDPRIGRIQAATPDPQSLLDHTSPPPPGGLAADGSLVFESILDDGIRQWTELTDTGPRALVRADALLPDGRTVGTIGMPAVDETGHWVAPARLPGHTGHLFNYDGVLYDLLVSGAPGTPPDLLFEGGAVIRGLTTSPSRRQMAFLVETAPRSINPWSFTGVEGIEKDVRLDHSDATGITPLLATGDPVPDGSGAAIDTVALRAVGDDGSVAALLGAPQGGGLYRFPPHGPPELVVGKQGNPGGLHFLWLGGAALAPDDTVFFSGLTGSGGYSPTNGSRVYRFRHGVYTLLGQPHDPSPDGEGFVVSLGWPHAINSHTALFAASLTLSSSYWDVFFWYPMNAGYFLADGRDKLLFVRVGWNAGQMPIRKIDIDPEGAANHHGQVALRARLADGRYAIFLFTPRLHWRSAGDGAWDDETNWTLSLTPAAMAPVTLDRRSTVEGPTAPTTVRKLTLTGGAHLAVNPAGPITVRGDLTLDASTTLTLPAQGTAPLTVEGTATLAGTLRLALPTTPPPPPGSRYSVVRASQITGTFDRVQPSLTTTTLTLERTATGIDAVVGP